MLNVITPQKLGDQVAAVDVLAVVDLILSRPRHGAMSASLAAIIAMAERIRDLDAIAGGAAELLRQIDAERGVYAFDCVRHAVTIAHVIEGMTGALAALGYEQSEPQPRPQGDYT